MIIIKNEKEIKLMQKAGRAAQKALMAAGADVRPGVTTGELDETVRRVLKSCDATPSFLGYNGFPAAACISVNEEVIHGIPGPKKVKEGDIVKIDVGAIIGGYHGDCAATFGAGSISPEAQALIDATKQSFYEGIKYARVGYRIQDISHAVQKYVEERNFSVVRSFVGHGVGANLHEDPEVPNYGTPGRGPRLEPGMTIAIEPMVNTGTYEVSVLRNRWTVVTNDLGLSAHYENTVLITKDDPVILTVGE